MAAKRTLTIHLTIKEGDSVKADVTLHFDISPAPSQPPTAGKTTFSGQVGVAFSDNAQLSPPGTTVSGIADPSTIPPGLTINTDGSISGTPSSAGSFDVVATLDNGQTP